jgi:LysM repeat protein
VSRIPEKNGRGPQSGRTFGNAVPGSPAGGRRERKLKPFVVVLALGLTATAVGAGFYLQHDAPGPEDTISWGGLVEHEVQPGESAEVIAAIYGVKVADLQAWNGKRKFQPGDKVAIFAREAGDDPAMEIEIKSALAELELQVREGLTTKKKAPKGSAQKFIPVLVADLTVSGGPPAAPRAAPKVQGKRVQVQVSDPAYLETLRGLNKKVDLSGPEKMASNTRYSSGATNDAIRDMFSKDRGTVASSAAKADRWTAGHSSGSTPAPAPPERGSSGSTNDYQSYAAFRAGQEREAAPIPPKLAMPAPKKCLAGPSDVAEGNGVTMASNVGLSEPDIRSTMSRFVPKALGCVSGASSFDGTVETELTVGCDGRVTAVSIEHNSGVPQAVAACLRDTLRYAPFPAHDMPDGYTFGYRVNVSR